MTGLDRVVAARARLDAATTACRQADAELTRAIAAAFAAGVPRAHIAQAAGMSRARLYQRLTESSS
jgi:DNA-binding phage protein